MGSKPTVRQTTASAAMNMMPPIVGVPTWTYASAGRPRVWPGRPFIFLSATAPKAPTPLDTKRYCKGHYQAYRHLYIFLFSQDFRNDLAFVHMMLFVTYDLVVLVALPSEDYDVPGQVVLYRPLDGTIRPRADDLLWRRAVPHALEDIFHHTSGCSCSRVIRGHDDKVRALGGYSAHDGPLFPVPVPCRIQREQPDVLKSPAHGAQHVLQRVRRVGVVMSIVSSVRRGPLHPCPSRRVRRPERLWRPQALCPAPVRRPNAQALYTENIPGMPSFALRLSAPCTTVKPTWKRLAQCLLRSLGLAVLAGEGRHRAFGASTMKRDHCRPGSLYRLHMEKSLASAAA